MSSLTLFNGSTIWWTSLSQTHKHSKWRVGLEQQWRKAVTHLGQHAKLLPHMLLSTGQQMIKELCTVICTDSLHCKGIGKTSPGSITPMETGITTREGTARAMLTTGEETCLMLGV